MDNKSCAMVGEGVAGAAIGAPCGHIVAAACEMCGLACATAGALTGASILCLACYAGTKFGKLHPIGKGAVVVSSTGVGAFAGASVAEYAALGAGVAASTPAMLAGATIGVVVVGGAVAFGHLAASADERNRQETRLSVVEETQQRQKEELEETQQRQKEEWEETQQRQKEEWEETQQRQKEEWETRFSNMEAIIQQLQANQQQNGNAQ